MHFDSQGLVPAVIQDAASLQVLMVAWMNEELLDRNKNINRGFRKLEVWKEAVDLYVFVKNRVRSLNDVPYKVRAQVEDSIFQCHSNIAEGYSRFSPKEKIRFINIAYSSLMELTC